MSQPGQLYKNYIEMGEGMSQPGQLYKNYIEMGEGDESTGSTTYNCYYKSMESCVGTNGL
jgi:hypothetical protein